jgi:hypothetical protein
MIFKNKQFLSKFKNEIIYVVIPLVITNYYWHLLTDKYINTVEKNNINDLLISSFAITSPIAGFITYATDIFSPQSFGLPIDFIMTNLDAFMSYVSNFLYTVVYFKLVDKLSIDFFYVILYFISAICIFLMITLYSYFNGLLNKRFLTVLAVIAFKYYLVSIVKHHIMKLEKTKNIYIDSLIYSLVSSFAYIIAYIMTYWI